MKIMVTTDWHLDAITDGVARWDEVEGLVDYSVKVAKEESVAVYIFNGDLCDPDGWNSVRAQAKIIQVGLELHAAGIAFIALAGNHDVVEDGLGTTTLSPLAAADLAEKVFEQPGEVVIANPNPARPDLHVVGLPFTPSSHKYDPEKAIKRMSNTRKGEATLVLSHLNIKGIAAGSETKDFARGREVYLPIEAVRRKWPAATIVSGHYHTSQEFNSVHVVGSLARLRHDEEAHDPSLFILDL